MKTICFIETDEDGCVEWSEGCVCVDDVYEHSIELVSKEEVELIIKELERRISDMSWALNPESMGQ